MRISDWCSCVFSTDQGSVCVRHWYSLLTCCCAQALKRLAPYIGTATHVNIASQKRAINYVNPCLVGKLYGTCTIPTSLLTCLPSHLSSNLRRQRPHNCRVD